jgi:hypothetical protein
VFTLYRSSEQGNEFVIVYPDNLSLSLSLSQPFLLNVCRLQAQQANSESAYRGMSDVFWRTLQHEGVSGFYKGILPNLLKVVPAASITYIVYEAMKKNLSLD